MPLVWKVVRKVDGRYSSAIIAGKALIEYKLNEPAFAPEWLAKAGYHPTAFLTLEQAKDWEPGTPNWVIFMAEANEIIRILPPMCSLGEIEQGKSLKRSVNGRKWFPATVMVKSLTLLEEYIPPQYPIFPVFTK